MEEFNISYSPVIRFTDLKILYNGTFAFYESYENVYHVIRECFRGFSDSLLASRQLYTEAPSHKLSAMLTEVRQQFSPFENRNLLWLLAGRSSYKRRA